MDGTDGTDGTGTLEPAGFDCPRCGSRVVEDLYGPCRDCRTALRARFDGAARADVEVAAYEPKMNVTPNAVALKD